MVWRKRITPTENKKKNVRNVKNVGRLLNAKGQKNVPSEGMYLPIDGSFGGVNTNKKDVEKKIRKAVDKIRVKKKNERQRCTLTDVIIIIFGFVNVAQ